jgi:caffeoyl-CoA O-methyltransferase
MNVRTKWTVVVLVAGLGLLAWGQRGGGFRGGPRGRGTEAVPALAKSDAEKRVLATLAEVQQIGETYLNVPVNDGRMLRVLAESVDAKNVVELGTSTGLSGMWFGLALMKTGGKLTTFELDSGRAALARTHFKKAGVDAFITVVEGDAHQNVTRLKDPIDVVFIDADKEGYLDYLNKLLPLVRPGGLILAHNVDTAPDYVRAVTTNPDLETVFAGENQGLGITLKKR